MKGQKPPAPIRGARPSDGGGDDDDDDNEEGGAGGEDDDSAADLVPRNDIG